MGSGEVVDDDDEEERWYVVCGRKMVEQRKRGQALILNGFSVFLSPSRNLLSHHNHNNHLHISQLHQLFHFHLFDCIAILTKSWLTVIP